MSPLHWKAEKFPWFIVDPHTQFLSKRFADMYIPYWSYVSHNCRECHMLCFVLKGSTFFILIVGPQPSLIG